MTNSKSLDVTLRSLSKNIPPKNGLKNLSMMASEKPSACGASQQHYRLLHTSQHVNRTPCFELPCTSRENGLTQQQMLKLRSQA